MIFHVGLTRGSRGAAGAGTGGAARLTTVSHYNWHVHTLGRRGQLAEACAHEVEVFDPAPAVMERLKGRERAQLLVQARARSQLHAFLDRWAQQLASVRAYGARWAIDVDPLSI